MVDVEPSQLVANHLTASDLSAALNNQNLVTPSGTAKMGDREIWWEPTAARRRLQN